MFAFLIGLFSYLGLRVVIFGLYKIDQNERAVKTVFGRAQRIPNRMTSQDQISECLRPDERDRYDYPQVRVIQPGGLYWKMPWEKIHKVSVATETMNMATDIESPRANSNGSLLEAVTRDQLNICLTGQIRFRVSERNLYGYFFGVRTPIVHVIGFFVSILRSRLANFQAPEISKPKEDFKPAISHDNDATPTAGISINDLRKNLRDINDLMVQECKSSEARYGIILDASLITGIDPPPEVESALAAINTAHNTVSSEISRAQSAADQTIVQSKRAVEIETLKALAEVEPLKALAAQLSELKSSGDGALNAFVRNVRLGLYKKAKRLIMEKDV